MSKSGVALFVDTSAWFEVFDACAPLHEVTVDAIQSRTGPSVTTTFVLAELVALVQGRLSHSVAVRAGSILRGSLDVQLIHPDEADEAAAWALFVERPHTEYSLTDCVSFVVMRRRGLSTAVALDRHFVQEGFDVVP